MSALTSYFGFDQPLHAPADGKVVAAVGDRPDQAIESSDVDNPVGDSGEADPEIYAGIAQKFPRQVARVFIREVAGPKNSEKRFMKAFRKIPRRLAMTFKEPEELEGAISGV